MAQALSSSPITVFVELILIGGYGTEERNVLIEWNGDPNNAWTIFNEKLKYGRDYHVAIPVSSDFRCFHHMGLFSFGGRVLDFLVNFVFIGTTQGAKMKIFLNISKKSKKIRREKSYLQR